jgi:hypothetical protein
MSIGSVVTMGFEIGTIGLVTTLGYGQGALPPPPPPVVSNQVYGPALTPWERCRWFEYCPPDEKEQRLKALERAKRIELGIIKSLPPLKAETRSEVLEVVRERVLTTLPSVALQPIKLDKEVVREIAKEISLDLKSVVKEGKRLREIQRVREIERLEAEEEEEAIEVATLFMLH